MAVYRNISLSFWTDRKVEDEFSPEDKYMYLYLLTNPYTNICGCYEISIKQISRQTGYNEEMTDRIIKRLEREHDVIRYSYSTNEMLIIKWGRYNWTRSEKLEKPIRKAIEGIKYENFQNYVTTLYDNIGDTVPIPYPYPMDTTVTVSVTDTVSDTGTVDEQKEVVRELPPKPKRAKSKNVKNCRNDNFEKFWSLYPKKIARATAVKAWAKVDEGLFDTILNELRKQRTSEAWTKESGKFIPYPTTWLNQKRWEDELEPVFIKKRDEVVLSD